MGARAKVNAVKKPSFEDEEDFEEYEPEEE
jgi:hypothetical protein